MDNPYDDMPSAEPASCDLGGCCEPWAAKVDARNGRRRLRLCEAHHDTWTAAERQLAAEREEMAGRGPSPQQWSALFGLARAFDVRARHARRKAG